MALNSPSGGCFFIVQEIIEFNAVDNQIAEIATSSPRLPSPPFDKEDLPTGLPEA